MEFNLTKVITLELLPGKLGKSLKEKSPTQNRDGTLDKRDHLPEVEFRKPLKVLTSLLVV